MRIKQVLLNLQSNALKFTQKGKVEVQVSIVDGGFLEVKVIDTGIGIKQEDQTKLFQLFGFVQDEQQLNTSGIGLGLVISKNIVEQFGGNIKFESTYDEGSVFSFKVKLGQEEQLVNQLNQEEPVEDIQVLKNQEELVYEWKPKVQNMGDVKYVRDLQRNDSERHLSSIEIEESLQSLRRV